MLKLIEACNASRFPEEMDAMFRNRAEIFAERLGWDVIVKDGYERDRFDDVNPLYLVSVDPVTGRYWGSLRLLPTTGPNMLRDVFPHLLEEGEVIESATNLGEFAHLRDRCARAAGAVEEWRRLRSGRVDRGDRRGRAPRGLDPDRLGVRRAHLAGPEGGRMRAGGHRTAAADRRRPDLRRFVRSEPRQPPGSVSRRIGNGRYGPCAGRQGTRFRVNAQIARS
jgi:Autoinducer synthase